MRRTGKLVLHHDDDRADAIKLGGHDLLNEGPSVFSSRGDQGLLAHVRGKFVFRHGEHLPLELGDDGCPVLSRAVLEDELNDVVLEGCTG